MPKQKAIRKDVPTRPKARRRKMQTETLELNLNRSQIVDQVAALLYATSIIPDNVDILNIQFSDLFGKSDKELCKLTISTRKELN